MIDEILLFIAIGFAAQLVDGAIGMAYGITASTVLISSGISPAMASASIHAAEVFTTGASGIAHWRLGNVSTAIVKKLAIPGIIGGILGAYILVMIKGEVIRPFVSIYLLIMGGVILRRALSDSTYRSAPPTRIGILGFSGGFLDAIGGGGWGPIVTTTLIGSGTTPRYAIGSANLAEFFVTTTITITFVTTIGLSLWPIITGLIIGGIMASPFAAYATRHLPDKPVMILVGAVVIILSLRSIYPYMIALID